MKVSIKILPKVSDLLSGKISMKMIRDVKIEDLLGRDPVAVDLTEVSNYISGETVLVTGAGGSIGSELSRQIARHQPWKLLLLGHSENSIFEIELELRKQHPQLQIESVIADVRDWRRMKAVFAAHLPKVVFHAAAHKHVPLMERNPVEAIKTNIIGTKNVAELSHHNGVSRFVLVSTDKAVNPVSIMGVSKRVAEMFVLGLGQRSQTKFVAVRFGNVMGSSGSVIPIFKRQIQHGGPVTITHPEMVRYFMTIPEAVQLIIQAGALASGSEIFILDMGKPIKIDKLARDLIRLSGFEPEVDIKVIYTGIRPGEKLYEELLTNEEGIAATRHGRIFVEKQLQITWHEFLRDLDQLEQLVENEVEERFDLGMKQLLQKIVPNYQAPFSAEQQEKVLQVQNSSHLAKVEIVTNV
jgi:FlaA1/EpsC-like NDP-sugar epimerase